MEIEIKIDPACGEPRVLIITDKVSDEVTALMKKLSESGAPPRSGGNTLCEGGFTSLSSALTRAALYASQTPR